MNPCNYDDHLERFAECDWVVEAIAERMDWNKSLYEKLQPNLKDDAILTSIIEETPVPTSGLTADS